MIKDTNPDHYKVDGANFIEYMNDPKISGFGNWMFANGFNSGVCEDSPTIDAVPLDKLCEWLAERYEPPYALIDIDKLRRPIDFRQQKEIWMAALTKWMEEKDAVD